MAGFDAKGGQVAAKALAVVALNDILVPGVDGAGRYLGNIDQLTQPERVAVGDGVPARLILVEPGEAHEQDRGLSLSSCELSPGCDCCACRPSRIDAGRGCARPWQDRR